MFIAYSALLSTAECVPEENTLASMLEALAKLPPTNMDTLAFLILHIQRVASHCDANKMPLSNLAKIFGPSVVGHATANPKDDVILHDTEKQPKVMMQLLKISGEYWRQFMPKKNHPETTTATIFPASPLPASPISPYQGPMKSPATPELRTGRWRTVLVVLCCCCCLEV